MRIYLIGAGVIAGRHAEALATLGADFELHAADPNPEARRAFAEANPRATLHDDAATMLASPARDDDVVVNATPPVLHHDLTLAALDSGRHVLCEKPLAMNADEARSMLRRARERGRRLGCCSNRMLANPATDAVVELLRRGALGRPYHVTWIERRMRGRTGIEYQPQSRWFLDPVKNGGGTLMDWGPYDFTTLHHVLKPRAVEVLAAFAATPQTAADPPGIPMTTEQHVGGALRCELEDGGSVFVTFERSACTHGAWRFTAEIEGDQGAVGWVWNPSMKGGQEISVARDRDGQRVEEVREVDKPAIAPGHLPLICSANGNGMTCPGFRWSSRHGLDVAAVYHLAPLTPEGFADIGRTARLLETVEGCQCVELSIPGKGWNRSDPAGDDVFASAIEPCLRIAERRGLTLSLYPHLNHWLERVEDAARLCRKLDHPNLRTVFCGFHWYAVDGRDLRAGDVYAKLRRSKMSIDEMIGRVARKPAWAELRGGR